MKNRIVLALGCVALIVGMQAALAADPAAPKATSKPVATGKKSMAEKGSYHVIHAKKAKLDCEDCHNKGPLPDNTVMLRLHDPLPKKSPGPVDHDGCYVCHKDLGNPVAKYAKK
jgi:hypothetical protein